MRLSSRLTQHVLSVSMERLHAVRLLAGQAVIGCSMPMPASIFASWSGTDTASQAAGRAILTNLRAKFSCATLKVCPAS